ncbi:unnamed protein product [Rhodiola kirilowii]
MGAAPATVVHPTRSPQLIDSALIRSRASETSLETSLVLEECASDFTPSIRSGAWADVGTRKTMEDVYVCLDNFMCAYGLQNSTNGPNAFYGYKSLYYYLSPALFDGHGGKHAAEFACQHLPRFIAEDEDFPREIKRAIASAFLHTDTAFAEACSLNSTIGSGTTALAALVVGRSLVVANAGDCRAVLSRKGKAIEMSRDHKPACSIERLRIEACGGYVDDGYLNGQVNVARAIGDWHMEGLKDMEGGPLTAEPELMTKELTKDDEFLILGCDGLWDVFRSQNAVDFARRRLQEHNDPAMCSKDLVNEALKRNSSDNLAVVVVCFQPHPPPNLVAPRTRVQRSISAEGLQELQGFLDSLAS